MKTVHSFDYATGLSLGPVVLTDGDISPLEPGVYLVPGNCTEVAPPTPGDRQVAVWGGGAWRLVDIPPPPPEPEPEIQPRLMSPLEFLGLFTDAEQLAVVSASMASPSINLWWTKLTMATFVDLADPRLAAGLGALVDAGLISAQRRDEVLA